MIPFWIRRMGSALLIIAAIPLFAQTPADINAFLDRVAARVEGYNPKASWTASIMSTQIETDRKWNPEKTIVVSKAVTVTEGRREEKALKVLETKDGKTQDITAQYLAEQSARREKERAKREAKPEPAPRDKPGEKPSGRRSFSLNISEILPFQPERRPDFIFKLQETTDADGRKLAVLDVRAKVKDSLNWEGTYTIDAVTGDLVRARIKPSETPSMVKELEVEVELEVFEEVNLIPKRTWIKVNAGFLFIKRIHMISEEIYSDIRITH